MKERIQPRARAPRIQPLIALREQIAALDAAMLVAAVSTEVGAVHKLRTSTRRVQAHLLLLDHLHRGDPPIRLPEHAKPMQAVLRRLRRIRRAAGTVRDLDVQTGIIGMDAPQKGEVHDGSKGDTVRKQAKQLRKHLEASREEEARALVDLLKEEDEELAAALRALEQAVKPARNRSLSASALLAHVKALFAAETDPVLRLRRVSKGENALPRRVEQLKEEQLHALRKSAKLCRYILEAAPEGSTARQVAEQFESLQEAGGRWHDWLLLQGISEKFHGSKAELTRRYGRHATAALAEYRLRIVELAPGLRG